MSEALARTFHSLAGRSCCFALIQGGSRFGIGTPCHSGCGIFRKRYEICVNRLIAKGLRLIMGLIFRERAGFGGGRREEGENECSGVNFEKKAKKVKKPLTEYGSPFSLASGYRLEIAKIIGPEALSQARGRGLMVFCRLCTTSCAESGLREREQLAAIWFLPM